MNRAAKNESASTSGSGREGSSEGSLEHTVLTSIAWIQGAPQIFSNCRMR